MFSKSIKEIQMDPYATHVDPNCEFLTGQGPDPYHAAKTESSTKQTLTMVLHSRLIPLS